MKQEQIKTIKQLILEVAIVAIIAIGMLVGSLFFGNSVEKDIKQGKAIINYEEQGTGNGTSEPVETGRVIVKYVDEEGNDLAESETIEGAIASEYETSRKQIDHYMSNGYEPINKAGNFKTEDITVTYVYKLVADAIEVEEDNNVITLKIENTTQNKEYKLKLEQESTEGEKLTGGKFSLMDVGNISEVVEGTTVNGELTLGVINVSNEVDDEVILGEKEAPKGYLKALKSTGASIQLNKSYNSETKAYELSATSADAEVELREDTENDEIILKVINDKKKTYELAVKKFVSSIDEEATERNVEAKVNLEGEIEYEETEQDVEVSDFEKVIYTIRVYNEGNQDMAGPVITENLPAGLTYIEDSELNEENGWSVQEGVLTSNKLVGTTIEGVDTATQTEVKYGEVQIEVLVEEDNATENILTNTINIPTDEREENSENNTDEETVNLVRIPDVYDLAVKKFASSINNEETGRGVTARLNDLKQIVYDENNNEATIKHNQKVVYTIRVYNEGNKNLNGTKVTDVIPEGLKFDSTSELNTQYGWTKNGNNVETNYLVSKEIAGAKAYKGELPNYEDIQIEFTLDEDDVPEEELSVINTVRIAKATNETDDLDNEDEDEVTLERTPKTYDFALKVFASEIQKQETGRNVTVGLNENNEIIYTEVRPARTVKDEQKVVYTIRVFNEGTGIISGTKVTDIVPAGLVLSENSEINTQYGWTKNGDNVETTYLLDKTISGAKLRKGEVPSFIDIKVEFDVVEDNTAEDVTTILNKASIEKAQNETDITDNEDEDTLDLQRREKTYNLNFKKFASSIGGENTGRDVKVELNENNEIVYTETTVEKEVKIGQKIVYTLRVINEGNQNITGTKITEDLPTGLKFVEDSEINNTYAWNVVDGKLETTYLEGITINGVRIEKGQVPNYEDVLVELEVTGEGLNETSNTITNTATLTKHELETNVEDNEAHDSVNFNGKLHYDLLVKKFASKIDNTSTGRNVKVTVNTDNELVYTKITNNKKVKDQQKITYVYRVFNNGDTDITGTKITESIPQGLKYLPESSTNQYYGWTENEGKLTTEFLVGKTIKAYDRSKIDSINYIDVEIEFEVVEDEVNENNLIVNTVKIDKNENEEEDEENNNEDTETVELERKEKTYDVIMKKFVYSLDGEKLDKEIVATLDENGNVIYENDNTKTSVNKNQKVIFTLRMFNIGNQEIAAKTVTDTIPTGLQYIEDSEINKKYNWTVVDSVATTNYLEGQTIAGFETENNETPKFVEVQMECLVTGDGVKANESMINTARMEPDTTDQNKENNEDEAELVLIPEKQKVSDLSMQKFLFSVDGKRIAKREIVAKNVNGKIVYSKNEETYKVSNNQKLVYTLRVYNVGDGQTSGRSVIENIPDGLKMLSDSEINKANGWKMYKKDKAGNLVAVEKAEEATVIKSDKLVSETIAGFEVENNETPRYKDVQVELIVDEDGITTEDRTVTNIAEIEKSKAEPNSDNDKSEEKVQVKEFDLNVTKYIKEITLKDNSGETTTKVGIDNKGKLIKKEVDKKKVNQTEVYVTYGLKVKNIGEIAGYATELTDYIPENFELVDNEYSWEVKGKTVKTKTLENKIIEPGSSRTVEVTFKWKLSETNLGERNNVAVISGYKNDYDAKDKTPDKDNEERFIISLKTGLFEISIISIIGVLAIVAIVISLKLRKDSKNN